MTQREDQAEREAYHIPSEEECLDLGIAVDERWFHLIGPDDFWEWYGEPEDSSFLRDGRGIMKRLNEQHNALTRARQSAEEVGRLKRERDAACENVAAVTAVARNYRLQGLQAAALLGERDKLRGLLKWLRVYATPEGQRRIDAALADTTQKHTEPSEKDSASGVQSIESARLAPGGSDSCPTCGHIRSLMDHLGFNGSGKTLLAIQDVLDEQPTPDHDATATVAEDADRNPSTGVGPHDEDEVERVARAMFDARTHFLEGSIFWNDEVEAGRAEERYVARAALEALDAIGEEVE